MNNIILQKVNRILLVSTFVIITVIFNSCSSGNEIIEKNPLNPPQSELPNNPEGQPEITDIQPILEWGDDVTTIKAKQKNLTNSIDSDTLLRYTNESGTFVIDYFFQNNSLVSACMTKANVSNVKDIMGIWTKDYTEITSSDDIFLLSSSDKSTLAYGKTLAGTDYNYASIAWSKVSSADEEIEEYDFTPSGTIDGYDYVDLGTGIGWATKNVGASSPEESGGYFMWAETIQHYYDYNWWYYSLYTGDKNKYLDYDKFRTPYSNIAGTSYDVAHIRMGSHWRMPSRAEFSSLTNNCDIQSGKYHNVDGYIITGATGKSIFIPKAGYKVRESTYSGTCLWSSEYCTKPSAYSASIYSNTVNVVDEEKYYGLTVRGVTELK